MPATELDQLSINTIRFLAIDAVQKANSGHPGLPMGTASMAYTLWTRHLRHNPANPQWINRDRFILSAGHGSMLLYALLHLTGYDLPLEQLQQFRQWDSLTPGHPEAGMTPGVEVTTGPLGQGFANGVGMAVAQRVMAERFNTAEHKLIDHYIYAIVSDGDLMEGVSAEAASYAGTQKLSSLIYLYDDNEISIEGSTDVTFREDVGMRFRAYGWQVLGPIDGNDLDAVNQAIEEAQDDKEHPSLIICTTTIGYGSPNKAGTHKVHGEPLGADEVAATRANLGWTAEPFVIPGEALEHFRAAMEQGAKLEAEWAKTLAAYRKANPDKAADLERMLKGDLPKGWDDGLKTVPADAPKTATRVSGGSAMNAIFEHYKDLVGGSADLEPSTKTWLKGSPEFGWQPGGQNLRFGIREHAMGSIALGIAYYGAGLVPFTATFLVFADYMRPPIRLAALSHKQVVFVFTHDSIGLGEDGPTHQPIEQLLTLRAIPRVHVIRPADANETNEAWRQAILYREGPTVLALSRQNLAALDQVKFGSAAGLAKGAYVLKESAGAKLVLVASGSEVHLALAAAEKLESEAVPTRVVSMPCWELFDAQSKEYRESVLPKATPKLAIEAGRTLGWEKYVGQEGDIIGLDRFGASAPGEVAFAKLGFTVDNVVSRAKALLK